MLHPGAFPQLGQEFHGSGVRGWFFLPSPPQHHTSILSTLFHTCPSSSSPNIVSIVLFSTDAKKSPSCPLERGKTCSVSLFFTVQWKYGAFLILLVCSSSPLLVTSVLTCLCGPFQAFIPSSSPSIFPDIYQPTAARSGKVK